MKLEIAPTFRYENCFTPGARPAPATAAASRSKAASPALPRSLRRSTSRVRRQVTVGLPLRRQLEPLWSLLAKRALHESVLKRIHVAAGVTRHLHDSLGSPRFFSKCKHSCLRLYSCFPDAQCVERALKTRGCADATILEVRLIDKRKETAERRQPGARLDGGARKIMGQFLSYPRSLTHTHFL